MQAIATRKAGTAISIDSLARQPAKRQSNIVAGLGKNEKAGLDMAEPEDPHYDPDELYGVLVTGLRRIQDAAKIGGRLANWFLTLPDDASMDVCTGIALFPEDGVDATTLVGAAVRAAEGVRGLSDTSSEPPALAASAFYNAPRRRPLSAVNTKGPLSPPTSTAISALPVQVGSSSMPNSVSPTWIRSQATIT